MPAQEKLSKLAFVLHLPPFCPETYEDWRTHSESCKGTIAFGEQAVAAPQCCAEKSLLSIPNGFGWKRQRWSDLIRISDWPHLPPPLPKNLKNWQKCSKGWPTCPGVASSAAVPPLCWPPFGVRPKGWRWSHNLLWCRPAKLGQQKCHWRRRRCGTAVPRWAEAVARDSEEMVEELATHWKDGNCE